MMFTIIGLPPSTKYKDLKVLIKSRCNLTDFILDDLMVDNSGLKKVRIGLANSNEGDHVFKCLDGYRMGGCVLSVVPVGKNVTGAAPQNVNQRQNFNQPQNDFQQSDYQGGVQRSQWSQPTNQWIPNQQNMGGQIPQNTFNFQQHQQPMQNIPYMPPQQNPNHQPPPIQRQEIKPFQPGHQFPSARDQFQPVRVSQDQRFGFPQTTMPEQAGSNRPDRSHVLRTVEIIDTPVNQPTASQRYTGQGYPIQDKPRTIMKDNFQGPTQYNLNQGTGTGQNLGQQPWTHQPQHAKPFGKSNPPSYEKPSFNNPAKRPELFKSSDFDKSHNYEKEYHGPGDMIRRDPVQKSPVRRLSPGKRGSPERVHDSRSSPGRRISPGRRMPPGRRMSPDRRVSPGRHTSPGRRVSPNRRLSPGRRISPFGRRTSPDRTMSPHERRNMSGSKTSMHDDTQANRAWSGRRDAPRRSSPGRRSPDRRSPPSRHSPGNSRYSPSRRHMEKSTDEYDRSGKLARSTYDAPSQASNQAMYSGGFRPSIHENVQYPIPGARKVESRNTPWQQNRDNALIVENIKKRDEEIIPPRPFDRPVHRVVEPNSSHSPRKSRSPIRREKSPIKDRFRRHSPSPRSPRRSWALEKRSPEAHEAPPPPIWPGQQGGREEPRTSFAASENKAKRNPVWEYEEKVDHHDNRRQNEDRRFPDNLIRVRNDLGTMPPQADRREPERDSFKRDDRFSQREGPKFSPRDEYDDKRPKFSPRDDFSKKELRFSPREDYTKAPKFSPRDDYKEPKFEVRETLARKEPTFSNDYEKKGPKFSPRENYDDSRRQDHPDRKQWEFQNKHAQDNYRRGDFPSKRDESSRIDVRREVLHKMSEELNKEFEDVHKRAQDFHKRAEEFKRGDDRRRGDYDDRSRRELEIKHYEDKPRHRDDYRNEYDARRREDKRDREPEWTIESNAKNSKYLALLALKAKKEKAVDELTQKILDKHDIDAEAEQNKRLCLEMKIALSRIINDMFAEKDVSFIEMIVKFNAKYSGAGEDKILRDIMSGFPSQFRPKRAATDYSEVPEKVPKRSPEPDFNKDIIASTINPAHIPEWNMNPLMANPILMPQYDIGQQMMPPMMVNAPMMMAPQFTQPFQDMQQHQVAQAAFDQGDELCYHLYLCKDDFEPFSEIQADYLKKFLIQEIVKVTENSHGWAPDLTLKGLQNSFRYEIVTRDELSRDWLLNFDFSEFSFFNVLVYTKEELWYERAAIWLPGHSRCRNIDPLTKLKLQNKKLDGVYIGKWKFVKKVVTPKGTRVYVDMPPSAARALEKHKMTLSYELQKVNVFLKAVAIDKDAFDKGLKDPSMTDETELKNAALNSPMPSLGQDPKIVKICLSGNKPLALQQARKIREMLIYNIFKYYQQDGGRSRIDFVKYGLVAPGYFGVLPENEESKRWLMDLHLGKLNRQQIIILGADESNTRYITMHIILPQENIPINTSLVHERLRQSNQGVKGLNIVKWKPRKIYSDRFKNKFEVDMDLESIETLAKMNFILDYVDENHPLQTVQVKYEKSEKQLHDLIKKYKAELHDTYDNTNMDLASTDSEDDIVFVGEVK